MSTSSKGNSSPNFAKRYGINQKTAWLFMSKVRKSMASSERYPLEGDCEVDECYIGGSEEGKIGRGSDKLPDEKHKKIKPFRKRLIKNRESLFVFLCDPDVPRTTMAQKGRSGT